MLVESFYAYLCTMVYVTAIRACGDLGHVRATIYHRT